MTEEKHQQTYERTGTGKIKREAREKQEKQWTEKRSRSGGREHQFD